jgi:tetratricopeptide (TPR) repeat protein
MSKANTAGNEKNLGREILFRLISISLPLLFLLLLEGILRLVSYGDNLNLFIQNPVEGYEAYLIVNPVVGKKYFHKLEYTAPPNDIFLKKKPEGTFRVFVMGSSTVVGFPYESNLMFSRILHKRLEDAFPGRDIEVVNTAITAINSYTLLDFAGQIVKYEPDAVLVYAGHNEFYGAFGVGSNESMSRSRGLTRLNLALMDFRFFQLIRNTAGKIGAGKSEQVHGTLMKRIVASQDIPFESEPYRLAMTRYKQNMGDLLAIFSDREIPVFFSEVVSNVKDIKPLSALSAGKEDEAWKTYVQAVTACNKGEYDYARDFFYKAKDLDGVRFRASEEVNEIIRKLAGEYRSYLVPMLDQFQAASPHGLIGNNLMTEHVHPNIAGEFLMADAFYREIAASGILGEEDQHSNYPSAYYKANWGYTQLDSLLAHHRIANLKTHWPFVPIETGEKDYRLTYSPVSKLDSIAFSAMKDPGKSLFDMRLSLAREYEAQGNLAAAYGEYEAMLRTNPYLAVNYRDAASALIQLGDLPLALNYFKKSLEYEPSFYALYRMGEICLIKGDYGSARRYFQEGFSLATDNEDKLRSLGKLYQSSVYNNQPAEAKAIAGQLQKYGATQYLRIPPKSYTYTRYIPFQTRNRVLAAEQMMSEGRFEEAREILEASLKRYDSHMARRYLGECYLQLGDTLSARSQLDRVKEEFAFDPAFRLQSLPN